MLLALGSVPCISVVRSGFAQVRAGVGFLLYLWSVVTFWECGRLKETEELEQVGPVCAEGLVVQGG